MHDPGDTVLINPGHVRDVGGKIKTDAQQLIGPGPDTIEEFQSILTQINNNNFPPQLFSTLYQFITIHHSAYTAVLQNRQMIGDVLQGTADNTEWTDVQTAALFNPLPTLGQYGPDVELLQ